MHFTARLLVAFTPLLLTFLLTWLTMEGHLNFGAGCKDVFLAVPLLIWSLVFFLCHVVLWWRKFTFGRLIAVSCAVATGVVVFAWVALFGFSLLTI